MVFLLFIVVCLVAWALYLMQEAVQRREFSLMLAGVLVSSAAAALVGVYFLVGHYVGYMSEMTARAALYNQSYEVSTLSDTHEFEQVWLGLTATERVR
jgi:hypothetical protein